MKSISIHLDQIELCEANRIAISNRRQELEGGSDRRLWDGTAGAWKMALVVGFERSTIPGWLEQICDIPPAYLEASRFVTRSVSSGMFSRLEEAFNRASQHQIAKLLKERGGRHSRAAIAAGVMIQIGLQDEPPSGVLSLASKKPLSDCLQVAYNSVATISPKVIAAANSVYELDLNEIVGRFKSRSEGRAIIAALEEANSSAARLAGAMAQLDSKIKELRSKRDIF